ncbi:TPA: MFS transporter [Klebsiella variicola subsp. variicola]|nr:MFS transporter [Klebsiella variicola]HBS5426785.1 MFS transporter [Klebsiella variicola subsp. variicola]HCI6140813.1 MFS transporter [Klebsiella variicola subsp. variicola]
MMTPLFNDASWGGIMSTELIKEEKLNIGAVLAVSLSTVIAMLDSTIANVALPVIAKDFAVSESSSILIINAYQFAVIASLLVFAALGRKVGNKRIFIMGTILFAFSSLGCALSETLNMLTVFRVVQGFGAAAILSVNAALIKDIYPARLLGRGLGINVMVVSVSAAAGPSIASAILSIANWNWLFTINVPIACTALVLCIVSLKSRQRMEARFDKAGGVLVFLTFISFSTMMLGLTKNNLIEVVLSAIILIILAFILYRDQRKKQDSALIPVAMFRSKTFSLSLLMSMLSYSTQLLAFVSLPFYFHNVLHRSVIEIGMLLTAWPLATMLTSLISGDLIKKHDPNLVALSGLSLLLAGTLLMTWLPAAPTNLQILWRVAICGFGFGLFQAPNNYLIMTSVSHENSSIASGLLGSSRLVGQIIGSALVAIFINIYASHGTSISLFAGALFSLLSLTVSYFRYKSENQTQNFNKKIV